VRQYGEQFRAPRRQRRARSAKSPPCSEWSVGRACLPFEPNLRST
jgi:hypothetical protein